MVFFMFVLFIARFMFIIRKYAKAEGGWIIRRDANGMKNKEEDSSNKKSPNVISISPIDIGTRNAGPSISTELFNRAMNKEANIAEVVLKILLVTINIERDRIAVRIAGKKENWNKYGTPKDLRVASSRWKPRSSDVEFPVK